MWRNSRAFAVKTDWRELEGVKPRWDNQVHVLDELLANMKNFSLSDESEGRLVFIDWP